MISSTLTQEHTPHEHMLAALQDIALLAIDGRQQLIYANAHAAEIFSIPLAPNAASPATLPACLLQPLQQALLRGEAGFIAQHDILGQTHTFEARISPMPAGQILWLQDATAHRQTELRLNNKSALLNALINCNWLSNSPESWRKNAHLDLELIGKASGYCHVGILQNKSQLNGNITTNKLFQWTIPAEEHCVPQALETLRFSDSACRRWHETLASGQTVAGMVSNLPPDERDFLHQHGFSALILIPIIVEGEWWGVMAFGRCGPCSEIFVHELDGLSAAARSLAVGIEREISSKRLQQAATAFESMSEGIMITNADNQIVAINQGFTEITGYFEADVLGQNPAMLQSGGHSPALYHAIWEGIGREGRWRGEISNRRKSGEIYPQWLTVTPIRDEDENIVSYVSVFSDITETKQSRQKLYALANHDSLTGLPNRRLLNELLEHAIRRAEREAGKVALLFIDLDRFKNINDTLGHQSGDRLLGQVSKRLASSVRDSDTVARLGGDEFVIMLDCLHDTEDAAFVAQKVCSALRSEFVIDGKEFFIGASIGISLYPNDGDTPEDLLRAADVAMYQVKNDGKNNYCFYSSDQSQSVFENMTLDTQLHRALERDQFEVYYQPQISLGTGRIVGAEALVRWHHPELGTISPAKFIPLAEETGLIIQIGEWVLRQAAQHAVQCQDLELPLQWIAINVSSVQIHRGNFADTVYGILVETGCDPQLLELEITESAIMNNAEYVIEVFKRIKDMGVNLALDDFGTGYSSLSYLKRFPLDKLKIDQSFVRGLPHDQEDAAIAGAIIALGQSLGFGVIAEGVETPEQEAFIRSKGCQEAQGYLYSRPVAFPALLELLRSQATQRDAS